MHITCIGTHSESENSNSKIRCSELRNLLKYHFKF